MRGHHVRCQGAKSPEMRACKHTIAHSQQPSATCLSISVSRHMNQQRLSLESFVMGHFTTAWQQPRATNSTIKRLSDGSACEDDHHLLSAWSDSMLLEFIMESALSSRNGTDKYQCSTKNKKHKCCLMQSVGYKQSSTTHSALSLKIGLIIGILAKQPLKLV